jgi:hypothetical protein
VDGVRVQGHVVDVEADTAHVLVAEDALQRRVKLKKLRTTLRLISAAKCSGYFFPNEFFLQKLYNFPRIDLVTL